MGNPVQQFVVYFTDYADDPKGVTKVVGVRAGDADTAKKLVEQGYGGAKVTKVV